MENDTCVWVNNYWLDDIFYFDTSCDNEYEFESLCPGEEGYHYCPYCGKKIEVREIRLQQETDDAS